MVEQSERAQKLLAFVEGLNQEPMPNTLPGMDAFIGVLHWFKEKTNGSGVFVVPFLKIAVVFGKEALSDLAKAELKYYKNPSGDKSGAIEKRMVHLLEVFGGRDGVMGDKEVSDKYKHILRKFISASFKPNRLRVEVPKAFEEWFSDKETIDTRTIQDYFAQISLSRLFPYIDWNKDSVSWAVSIVEGASPAATVAFVDDLKSSNPNVENYLDKPLPGGAHFAFSEFGSILYEEYVAALTSGDDSKEAAAKESFFYAFAQHFAEEKNPTITPQELDTITGELTDIELADVIANIISVVSASYGTVATGLGGMLRALALEPELQEEVRAVFGKIRDENEDLTSAFNPAIKGTVVETLMYRGLGNEVPLPALSRFTEFPLNLNKKKIERDYRIVGLLRAPMLDESVFPKGESFGKALTDEQKGVIRLIWGLIEIGINDPKGPRHCLGYESSHNMMYMTLNEVLKHLPWLTLEQDSALSSRGSTSSRESLIIGTGRRPEPKS